MSEHIGQKQAERILEECNEGQLFVTSEFHQVLDALENGAGLAGVIESLVSNTNQLQINLALFEKFYETFALYLNDETKEGLLNKLYILFFNEGQDCQDEIFDIFLKIAQSINNSELRMGAAAMSTHLLEQDPCSTDTREKVLALIRRDNPDFKF